MSPTALLLQDTYPSWLYPRQDRRDHHLGALGQLDAGQGVSESGHELL